MKYGNLEEEGITQYHSVEKERPLMRVSGEGVHLPGRGYKTEQGGGTRAAEEWKSSISTLSR